MKKYLIKGALALFAGTFVLSCAEKESEYVPVAQQKVKAFEEVFKEVYGDNIDPYQDWGFNQGKTHLDPTDESIFVDVVDAEGDPVFTRAAAFGHNAVMAFPNRTREAYPNANMWASSYVVPPELTEAQKDVVRQYFQQVPYVTYNDPHWSNYFVQQVYKGHTTVGEDSGTKTSESYKSADNGSVIGSDHMDHLCAVFPNLTKDHINNFNFGDASENTNILDNGYDVNQIGDHHHSDKIMLMVNSTTNAFGYFNSDGSLGHTEYTGLVSWETIRDWANTTLGAGKGDCLDDGWNRSYMGFDFEQVVGDDIYAKILDYEHADYSVNPAVIPFLDYVWFEWNGAKYHVLDSDMNQYCGDLFTCDDTDLQKEGFIDKLLSKGYLPVSGGANKKWVKVGGCADHYFSDWIVSLTEAKAPEYEQEYETEIEKWTPYEQGRVFCEDLGRATREDLDYNDVVFDVIIWQRDYTYKKILKRYSDKEKTHKIGEDIIVVPESIAEPKYYAQVTLLAAGGTIPVSVKIGDTEFVVHDQFNDPERTATETMVNTRDNNSSAYGSFATRAAVQLEGTDVLKRTFVKRDNVIEEEESKVTMSLFPDISAISQIGIWTAFGGDNGTDVAELTSEKGGAPQKFMADIGTPWASERKNISLAYPGGTDAEGNHIASFNEWVENHDRKPWAAPDFNHVYTTAYSDNGYQVPYAMRVQRTYSVAGEHIIWEGEKEFGHNAEWSLAKLDDINMKYVGQFFAGDLIRFYAKDMPIPENGEKFTDDEKKAWITVVINSITPYFIDQEFPNYVRENNVNVFKTEGCLEVVLDEYAANMLNTAISNASGMLTIEVQGRNFTLTKICVVDRN